MYYMQNNLSKIFNKSNVDHFKDAFHGTFIEIVRE